ncbi:MAG: hypothetical protein KA953_00605 [Lachnospiraceae bacterium]|nr:hypothetical protein [Lachnospiraceae bacterium]
MKIILNKSYGGFGASYEAYELYAKKMGIELYAYKFDFGLLEWVRTTGTSEPCIIYSRVNCDKIKDLKDTLYLSGGMRTDKTFIEVVEELGDKASSSLSELKVFEIPDNSDYIVSDYDGIETLYYSESKIYER